MGDFNVEVVGEDTINNERMENKFLVEGLDDTVNERPARWHQTNNGVRPRLTLVLVEMIWQHNFSM